MVFSIAARYCEVQRSGSRLGQFGNNLDLLGHFRKLGVDGSRPRFGPDTSSTMLAHQPGVETSSAVETEDCLHCTVLTPKCLGEGLCTNLTTC